MKNFAVLRFFGSFTARAPRGVRGLLIAGAAWRRWNILCAGFACVAAHAAGPFVVNTQNPALVTDQATGFMWQRCIEGLTWDSLADTCAGTVRDFSLGGAFDVARAANAENDGVGRAGFNDWRVPGRDELYALVTGAPATSGPSFPTIPELWSQRRVWSGLFASDGNAWMIDFRSAESGLWGPPRFGGMVLLVRSPNASDVSYINAAVSGPGGDVAQKRLPVAPDGTGSARFDVQPEVGYQLDAVTTTCPLRRVDGNQIYVMGKPNADCDVTLSFKALMVNIHTVAEPSAGGAVTCSPNPLRQGTDTTCTATPAPGYRLFSWGGDCTGADRAAVCRFETVMSARNVLANFMPVAEANPGTITVTSAGDIGVSDALGRKQCSADSGDRTCTTLRDAVNSARHGERIVFAPELDGQTISLTRFTNCLTTNQGAGATCLPLLQWPLVQGSFTQRHVTQFGPSAFFISGRSITIDAATEGMTHGVVLSAAAANTDCSAGSCFRLFDIDATVGSGLTLRGITVTGGVTWGGGGFAGGGALGAGGAIFNRGSLVAERSSFVSNRATGGYTGSFSYASGSAGGGVGASAVGILETGEHIGGGPNRGASAEVYCSVGPDGKPFCLSEGPGKSGGFGGGGGYGSDSNWGGFGGGGATSVPRSMAGGAGGGGFGAGGGGYGIVLTGDTDPKPAYPRGNSGGFGGGVGGKEGGGGAGMGGAVFNDAGAVTLVNVTMTANRAVGGRSFSYGAGGAGYGGALFNYAGALRLDHVTLSDNLVVAGAVPPDGGASLPFGRSSDPARPAPGAADGAAVYSLGDAQCGVGANVCATGGVAILQIRGSVIAGTSASGVQVVVEAIRDGSSTSQGLGNRIASHRGFAGDSTSIGDARLASLRPGLQGGLTDVLLPQLDSPLLDGVACASAIGVDQRGVSRPQGVSCDLGAVERRVWPRKVVVNVFGAGVIAGSPSTPNSPGTGSLAQCREGQSCTAEFQGEGDPINLVLTAQPDENQIFSGWGGACSAAGSAPVCHLVPNAQQTVEARFEVKTYAISAAAEPMVGGTVTCTPNPISHGADSNCTASPTNGFAFAGFGQDCAGLVCNLLNIQGPLSVTANFIPITTFSGPTMPSSGTGGEATARFTGGGDTCRFDKTSTAFIAAPVSPPAGALLPQGMFKFQLIGCDTTPVTFSIDWPQPVHGLTKWGLKGAGAQPSYFPPDELRISGHNTTFTVIDGQKGDDDWEENGTIVDPVGPTASVMLAPIPTLGQSGVMLLGLLAAGLGVVSLRRQAARD